MTVAEFRCGGTRVSLPASGRSNAGRDQRKGGFAVERERPGRTNGPALPASRENGADGTAGRSTAWPAAVTRSVPGTGKPSIQTLGESVRTGRGTVSGEDNIMGWFKGWFKKQDEEQWDTAVHFGRGKQKGETFSGFHLNQAGTMSVFTGLLWRGDSRDPTGKGGLFDSGLHPHKAGVKVSGRTTSKVVGLSTSHGTTRGGISMSKSITSALIWAAAGAKLNRHGYGWLYLVYLENEEWAAEIAWNVKDYSSQVALRAAKQQVEIMLRDVNADRIVGARKVAHDMRLLQNVVLNPHYAGPDVLTLCATDWGISKFKTQGDLTINFMDPAVSTYMDSL